MKILVAPNSMKGTLNAPEFADAIVQGLKNAGHSDIVKLPLADGGDGTANILAESFNATHITCKVRDPLFREIESGFYLNKNNVALIEMADASGLKLLHSSEYSASKTTSFGTGQLIREALKHGAQTILIGLGGSATVDGGMGVLMALGVKFYSTTSQIQFASAKTMGGVVYMDIEESIDLLKGVKLIILSDVKNKLLGKNGASFVFAPQKGASPTEVNNLEKNMSLFCGALFQTTGKDVSQLEGGGAAGGISAALSAIYNATIVNGASYILDNVGFYEKAIETDVIITGEGKIDFTSLTGKASEEILNYGMKIDVPVYAICGVNQLIDSNPFRSVFSLSDYCESESDIMENTYRWVVKVAEALGGKLKYKLIV